MLADIRYQIGLVNATGTSLAGQLPPLLDKRAQELGLDPSREFQYFQNADVANMSGAAPKAIVYFGGANRNTSFDSVVDGRVHEGDVVIPVVPTTTGFSRQVPESLKPVNGMAIPAEADLPRLTSLVLETLHLMRRRRRVFISYKRAESEVAATQLYNALDARSFDPFLDTHSIREGDPFQERLWHRMADSDLTILLYTKTVLDSGWVEKELDRADAMGITVLQVIWPRVPRDPRTALFEPLYLEDGDFEKDVLNDRKLKEIVIKTESLRARSLAAREAKLVKALCGIAAQQNVPFAVQRTRCVDLCPESDKFTRVFLGLGVPDAMSFQEATDPLGSRQPSQTYLMYDPFCVAPYYQKHLDWFDRYSPVKALKPAGVVSWLQGMNCSS
jgi:hypothetical protein